jgi:hypothetical protein
MRVEKQRPHRKKKRHRKRIFGGKDKFDRVYTLFDRVRVASGSLGLARSSGIKHLGRGRGSIFERGVHFINFFNKFFIKFL